ncbi:MAG: glutathione S-transferase C-terminal domain-containing protein [Pseudomonadota bacterium]
METPLLVNLAPAVSTDVCRWCFQHWGIKNRECVHVPVFHLVALKWFGTSNDQRPLVVVGDERYRTESEITAHFDPLAAPERRLIPEGELGELGELGETVLAETNYYHKTMRRGVVSYMYWNMLQNRQLVWPSFTKHTSWFEPPLALIVWPVIRIGLIKGLDLSAENAIKALDVVREGFDRVEATLADGRPYLTGDSFTLADLTFAASAAPIVLADGYAGHLPEEAALPAEMQTVVNEFRARPAGDFCQRMYDLHRKPSAG